MALTRKTLCVVYGLIGVLALIGTWGNNIRYMGLGFIAANAHFWDETLINPASRSITVDLIFLMLATSVWMLLEARRLKMRAAWAYIALGVVVAISVTFPIFLINRERALARAEGAVAGSLGGLDVAILAVLTAVGVIYAAFTLLF